MYNSLAQKFLFISVMSFSMLTAFSQSDVKRVEEVGNRRIITLDVNRVAEELSTLLAEQDLTASDVAALTTALSGLTWADVLSNGSTSNADVSLGNHDLSGVSTLTVELISGDSMVVAKVIDGRIGSLSNHDTDNLSEGATNLYFTDTRARSSISGGTGVTYASATGAIAIGQSVGTADDVSFAGVAASATVTADSISVTDVINGQVDDISNHDTDNLSEGATNLYFTDTRARSSISGGTGVTYASATGAIAIGQSVGTADDVSFAGVAASATVTADSISVTDVINGQVDDISNHDTDDLPEGATNLYMTSTERDLIVAMDHAIDSLSCTWLKYQDVMYELILIGEQCWFRENLRSTSYNDGSTIPNGLSTTDWINTTYGAVTVYEVGGSNEAANLADYGRLYNWFAVNTGLLCPTGWHVPTDWEWITLEMALGMTFSEANNTGFRGTDQGTQLKSSQFDSPSWNGSNTSGFSALAGGVIDLNGSFGEAGNLGFWWSSSYYYGFAWYHGLSSDSDGVSRNPNYLQSGFSVRCVRD